MKSRQTKRLSKFAEPGSGKIRGGEASHAAPLQRAVRAPSAHPSSSAHILQLQRMIGNRAVQRLLNKQSGGRTGLTEQSGSTTGSAADAVQRMTLAEEEEGLQAKLAAPAVQRMGLEEEEGVQAKRAFDANAAPAQRKGDGSLPDGVRMKMEGVFGSDFSAVKVHEGSEASEIGALAYTQGNDIHFAPGQFDPDSSAGQELLGHELTHVVQQRQGKVQPTTQAKGVPINDDPRLEQEADRQGKRAAGLPDVQPSGK